MWSDRVVQDSVGLLTSSSTLSNKFKVLHDRDKMDYCGGYSEANEKEETVASGYVAHEFDLGSNKSEQKKITELQNTEKISKKVKQNKNVGTDCETQDSVDALNGASGNLAQSNEFKALFDKDEMDHCVGYSEVNENESMDKRLEFDSDSDYSESREMVEFMVDGDDSDSVSWGGYASDEKSLSEDGSDLVSGETEVEKSSECNEVVATVMVKGCEDVPDDKNLCTKLKGKHIGSPPTVNCCFRRSAMESDLFNGELFFTNRNWKDPANKILARKLPGNPKSCNAFLGSIFNKGLDENLLKKIGPCGNHKLSTARAFLAACFSPPVIGSGGAHDYLQCGIPGLSYPQFSCAKSVSSITCEICVPYQKWAFENCMNHTPLRKQGATVDKIMSDNFSVSFSGLRQVYEHSVSKSHLEAIEFCLSSEKKKDVRDKQSVPKQQNLDKYFKPHNWKSMPLN